MSTIRSGSSRARTSGGSARANRSLLRKWVTAVVLTAAVSAAAISGAVWTPGKEERPVPRQAASQAGALVPRPGKGETMPAFQLEELGGGRTVSLEEFRGKPLVVNFWASWCPTCASEMPDFEALHKELAGQIAFLGVNLGDSTGPARDLASRTGVTYLLVSDPDGKLYRDVRGLGMPLTLFVTADGHIAKRVSGGLDRDALRKVVFEELLQLASQEGG